MQKKIFKAIGFIGLTLVIIAAGVFMYFYFNHFIIVFDGKELEVQGHPVIEHQLSKEEVKEDIDYIIDIMESTHPIFLEEVPEKYYIAKNELLSASDEAMTVGELQYKVSRYLSSIQDGHTTLWWNENTHLYIGWKYINGKLYLLDDQKKLTNKVITKIGDVDIDKIVETIKATFPAENYVAEAKNIEIYSKSKLVLENAGVDCTKDILLTLNNEGQEENLVAQFSDVRAYEYIDHGIYSKVIDESIAYIRLGECKVNLDLKSVVEDIKKYKNQGIKDYIIDVTDNGGGDSTACEMLLKALDMKPGSYGTVTKFSPLAQERKGYLRKSGYVKNKSNNKAVKNEDINLYILTNEVTFSSTQMLAVWVRDGNLGKIIGRPSSNMPSSYGDVVRFRLKNSKLAGQISHRKWIRPDISKDKERVLEPDIYVEYGEDILERAIEEIK